MKKRLAGFALMEVALALIILGVVTSFILPLIHSYLTLEAAKKTEAHQQHIFAALANHVLRYNRLPCPAQESEPGKAPKHCPQGIGHIPFKTLGLPEHVAKDGHKHWFTYIVNPELTSITIQSLDQGGVKCFCQANNRHLTIENVELPDHDCIAFALSTAPVPPSSLQLKNTHSHPLVWISRDLLMANYAKRPCQPLTSQPAPRPSIGLPHPPLNLFNRREAQS